MSKSIVQNIPDAHQLLGLDTEELAGYVLEHLHACGGNPLKQGNSLPHNLANDLAPRYEQDRDRVYKKIIAACHYLISNNFLDIINQQGFYEISKKGNDVRRAAHFRAHLNERSSRSSYSFPKVGLPDPDECADERSATKKDRTTADRLYEKVKSFIENAFPLDEDKARIIVESADDAIKEFGSTNQEKKVELRKWKEQAESVLPPDTVEELRKRAERQLLRRTYPRHRVLRKLVLALVALAVIAGAIAAATGNLTKLMSLFSASSKTPPVEEFVAIIEVENAGKDRVEIQELCEFYLTESKGLMMHEYPSGRAVLLSIDPSDVKDRYFLNAGESRLYRLPLPNKAGYSQLLDRGAANVHFLVRIVDSRQFGMGSIPFQRDALNTYKVSVKINAPK